MHLSWIVFILLSGQIQINAIQFPIVIPRIMIKIPMAFVSLIRAAPRWDNACLYDSDKVAVPFVSSLCDSWHSDVVFSPWMPLLTLICCKKRGGGGRWIRCCEQRQTRVCQSPSVAVVILWLFENCLNMCKLARNVKQQRFLLKLFFMEPLVWIPSLTNFKGDKREGCKTQLRIRKKKVPETTCACLKPLIPLTTFYCSFSLLFSPSQSCRRKPELRTAQAGFLFF